MYSSRSLPRNSLGACTFLCGFATPHRQLIVSTAFFYKNYVQRLSSTCYLSTLLHSQHCFSTLNLNTEFFTGFSYFPFENHSHVSNSLLCTLLDYKVSHFQPGYILLSVFRQHLRLPPCFEAIDLTIGNVLGSL